MLAVRWVIVCMLGALGIAYFLVAHVSNSQEYKQKTLLNTEASSEKKHASAVTALSLNEWGLSGLCAQSRQIKHLQQDQPFKGGTKRFEPLKIVGKAVSESFFVCQIEGKQITSDHEGHDYASTFAQYNLIGAINSKQSVQMNAEIVDSKALEEFLLAQREN